MNVSPEYKAIDEFAKAFSEGKTLKVWHAGPKPFMKRGISIVVGLAFLAGSVFYSSQHENLSSVSTTPKFWQDMSNGLKNTTSGILNAAKNTISNIKAEGIKPNRSSNLVNDKNADRLYKLSAFSTTNVSEKNMGRHIAQIMNDKKEFFLSLVAESEGFRSTGYADNVGVAIGFGWNVTMQTTAYNDDLALAVSPNKEKAQALLAFSKGKKNNETLTPQQAVMIVELMGEQFKIGFIEAFARNSGQNKMAQAWQKTNKKTAREFATYVFEQLPENKKSALLTHTFKVGGGGAARYKGLFNALIEQELSGAEGDDKIALAKKTAEHFTYKYQLGGEILEDTRASALISSMYLDPEVYEYTIGKKLKVSNMGDKVPALNRLKISVSANGDLVIPDPVGEKKAEQIHLGKPAAAQIMPPENEAPKKRHGGMSWSHG